MYIPKNKSKMMEADDIMITNMFNQFQRCNWKNITNEPGHIIFKKGTSNYDIIEMKKHNENVIFVTIPIKSGPYQYTTRFAKYDDATNYINMHIHNYESKD